MKYKIVLIAVAIIFVLSVSWILISSKLNKEQSKILPKPNIPSDTAVATSNDPEVIAQDMDTPWAISFLPDMNLLVTERKGSVWLISANKSKIPQKIADIPSVKEIGEGGLLGIAVHPEFEQNRLIYLYYTYAGTSTNNTLNKVVRYRFNETQLADEQVIVDQIPGAANHNGGRIKFGPDGYLYITTGDAQQPSKAQDKNSMAGKILRVNENGKAASDNPFANNVYTLGHRNPQGLAWDLNNKLWSTEHGPSVTQFGEDEINQISVGQNYGWPDLHGDLTKNGFTSPVKQSTKKITWAPSGAAFVGNSLFFAGLRSQTLYQVTLNNDKITEWKEHFKGKYGRLREVILGPDGMLYLTTSNQDGRGKPNANDDKILRVDPSKLNSPI